ncbi:metallophosphoesterase [bacterium]|nr:metallophosphoesterase [bacterium]
MNPLKLSKLLLLFIVCSSLAGAGQTENPNQVKTIRFVSFPDFFNFDVPEPWPKYDAAVDYFLGQVKSENPDFVLIDGDLVDGRWWDSPQCVEVNGTVYFSGWVRRMKQYGLKFYTAVGDHELGDDPWPREKRELVPHFENVYRNCLRMPQNGPENKKGLAYYVREGNLLIVTVETFEVVDDSMRIAVIGEQLEWFEKTLEANKDAAFKIVQGHVGLWGDLKSRSSSRLMLEQGKESEFYKVMVRYGVDAYFAGEFHDVTVLEDDGIWQIVHGSSWGREVVNTEDYLVCEITGNQLNFTLKRIYMEVDGGYMWNVNKPRGPREIVRISEKSLSDGPEITGTLTIINDGSGKTFTNSTGYFNQDK